jgi:peptidoglycan/LPS O-acetylase OafA/YrhL
MYPSTPTSVSVSVASTRGWIAQLDGLRAVAVLAVLVHHYNSKFIIDFALGNVAVGVFFGISGFLAYYVLQRDELRWGEVSYNWFMVRRALRIWPLYFFVILSVLLLEVLKGQPIHGIVPLFSFTQNIEMARWGTWPPGALAPLWSISIEEQFYLLAPLAYFLMNSRFAVPFVIAVILLANILRVDAVLANTMSGNGGLYYASYAYIDVFLAGMIVAKLHRPGLKRSPWPSFVLATVLLLITMRLWGMSVFPPYPWYAPVPYFILPIAVGLLLWSLLNCRPFLISELLSQRVLTGIGTLSYGMYAVHLLVLYDLKPFLFDRFGLENMRLIGHNIATMALVVLVATCLYGLIERPFLRLKDRLSPKTVSTINPRGVPWAIVVPIFAISIGLLYQVANH